MEIQYIGMACALCLSAIGSAIGAGCASMSAVGAWKKCYANGKPASIRSAVESGSSTPTLAMFVGIVAGIAIATSALFQGKAAACAADALGETGKGTANYFIVIGIIETVALFTLVFSLLLLQ